MNLGGHLLIKQHIKIGSLVKAGWPRIVEQALRQEDRNYIYAWASSTGVAGMAGTLASSSIKAGVYGIVISNPKGSMIEVQWPKCRGWVYEESVVVIQA